jgi:hypothetical protein
VYLNRNFHVLTALVVSDAPTFSSCDYLINIESDSVPDTSPISPRDWTVARLAEHLRQHQVKDQAVAAFVNDGITGSHVMVRAYLTLLRYLMLSGSHCRGPL